MKFRIIYEEYFFQQRKFFPFAPNFNLAKKSPNKKVKRYPYQCFDLHDLPRERWKDMPGLDGYYSISNYGRIKRSEYEMQYKNGAIYLKPEMIIKTFIVTQQNKYKKDFTHFLVGKVKLKGKRHNFTVARLVYYCFVDRFDLNDKNLVIVTKDGNNFNIRPSNLKLMNLKTKQQRTIERGRFSSPLLNLSKEFRKQVRKKIIKTISKKVTQYTLLGKKVKTFPSMAEAQRVTGVHYISIASAASGRTITAGGFIWAWRYNERIRITLKKRR